MTERECVFLQDVPATLGVNQISDAILRLSVQVEFLVIEPTTSSGTFKIVLPNEKEKLSLLRQGCLLVMDGSNNEFYLPMTSNNIGDLSSLMGPPKTSSGGLKCPLCPQVLDCLSEEERNAHVLSCLGTPVPLNNQDQVFDPPYIIHDSPFGIKCPYPNCNRQYEARDFPKHATLHHLRDPQNYACPICIIQGNITYTVTSNTNLLSHLQNQHIDLINPPPSPEWEDDFYFPEFSEKEFELQNPPQTTHAQQQPPDYIAIMVSETALININKECSICFCEYQKGEVLARLPCLCLYHQNCVEGWFAKKKERVCPLHVNK